MGGIKIYFMHYDTFENAYSKWKERIERIHRENMCVWLQIGVGMKAF